MSLRCSDIPNLGMSCSESRTIRLSDDPSFEVWIRECVRVRAYFLRDDPDAGGVQRGRPPGTAEGRSTGGAP
jgi:hypothetical protein